MRVVEELGLDQVFEEASLFTSLLQVLEVSIEVQRAVWVATVVVSGHAAEQDLEGVRKTGVGSLAFFELEPVDRRIHLGAVDALAGQPVERIDNDLLHLSCISRHDVLEARAEHGFPIVVLKTAAIGHRGAQTRIDERLAQRRAGVGQEHIGEHVHCEHSERVAGCNRDPGDQGLRLLAVVLARRDRVGLDGHHRFREALDWRDRGVHLDPLEA